MMKTPKGTELPLMKLKGKDYLLVAHRLVWFREEHQDWCIETSFDVLKDEYAIAKAIIKNQNGVIIATAHKREDAKHFPDFTEKAETGAIGRALALCGYGTQFAPELDEGDRVVDAPLARDHVIAAVKHLDAIEKRDTEAPGMCCGKKMMVSKFNQDEVYCITCKRKAKRAA